MVIQNNSEWLLKYQIIQDNKIVKDESKKNENYSTLKEYASLNITKKEPTPSTSQIHNIPFKPPKYEFQKRMYISKDKHLKFHEKASIVKLEQWVGGEINSSQKSVNFNAIIHLNQVGAFIFKKLQEDDLSLEQVAKAIVEEYDIDEQTALNDAANFISKLKENGIL